jgi:4-amino-4-deoxy-L-arabinose transferase-like glycosyltransferase
MMLAALAIRLAVIPFVYGEWMQPYFAGHWEQGNVARALIAGHGFGSPFPADMPSAIMPPVYCLIVAGTFLVFGIHTVSAIIASLSINCLFSALACVPVYLVARRSFGERVAKWAGWGWAFSPYGIYFAAEWAWSTHLLILLLYWILYLEQSLEASDRLSLWAGFGALCGLAALTEPVVLSIVPFLLALALFRLWRAGKRWFAPGLIAALVLTMALSPWIIRNYTVFHRFIPMRDSMGLELYLGNTGYSLHWINADRHPNHDAAQLQEYKQGELAFMDHKRQQAVEFIRTHRRWYAWMCVRRAVYIWTGFWSFDHDYLAQEPLDPPNILLQTTLTVLALAGLQKTFKTHKLEALRYAGVLFLFPLMYYFTHPQAYHLRPLDPLILILGVYAVLRPRRDPTTDAFRMDGETP